MRFTCFMLFFCALLPSLFLALLHWNLGESRWISAGTLCSRHASLLLDGSTAYTLLTFQKITHRQETNCTIWPYLD